MTRLGGLPQRILLSMAAVIAGSVFVLYAVPPALAEIGRGSNSRGMVWAFGLLVSCALLTWAAIRPRSIIAAAGAALPIGVLLIWGMGALPLTWPRLLLHLTAILCLAALLIQVTRGIADRRFRMLWILPCLLLGFPIGFFSGGLIGLHIWLQYCQLPLMGAEISSIVCSG